ncbi:PEP-CTERM sorting domain-containing protein [Roseateles sp. LYH14W]|uniref:PEP-CTERM sorting domain-containing protein n=1 Tax=Pelomonas parva TaxID=3299032 RepID=A0ABW7F3H4_9BURK
MLNLKAPVAIATLLLAGAAGAATTNGIANGGFETINPATNLPFGWAGGDSSAPVLSDEAHTGAHSMLLSRPGGFGGSALEQNSLGDGGLPALTAANVGDTPWLNFWVKGDVSPTGNAKYSLSYIGDGGVVLYDSGLQHFMDGNAKTDWTQISFQAAAIPAGAQAVRFFINTAVGPLLDGRVNAIYVDDIQLTLTTAPVPEPSSYALLAGGLAVLGMAVRRRRA